MQRLVNLPPIPTFVSPWMSPMCCPHTLSFLKVFMLINCPFLTSEGILPPCTVIVTLQPHSCLQQLILQSLPPFSRSLSCFAYKVPRWNGMWLEALSSARQHSLWTACSLLNGVLTDHSWVSQRGSPGNHSAASSLGPRVCAPLMEIPLTSKNWNNTYFKYIIWWKQMSADTAYVIDIWFIQDLCMLCLRFINDNLRLLCLI